jgi:Tol biopolymer transport system component
MKLRHLFLATALLFITACGGDGSSNPGPEAPAPADGRIAFVVDYLGADADMDIYTVHPDGTNLRRLTRRSYLNTAPGWSPDGTRIAFMSNRTGYFSNVFVMKSDGSGVTNLTKDNDKDHRLIAWASDGRLLIDKGSGTTYQLTLLDPSGKAAPRALTQSSELALNEALSPDGTRVAFDDIRSVQVIQLDDRLTRTRLTTATERIDNEDPAWSPDGTRIAFTSTRDGISEVFDMNADGTGQTKLSNGMHSAMSPRWSPDGKRIAFLRNAKDVTEIRSKTQLWLVNADGSGETRLTHQTCDGQYGVTWSPDSTRVAFTRGCDAQTSSREATQLYVINTDGTSERRLAAEINRSITSPTWSAAPAR